MKKTLITAVTLAACAATQLFAQNVKEGVITFALQKQGQVSVSTVKNTINAGNWSAGPKFYSTIVPGKGTPFTAVNTTHILQDIGFVLHGNAGYYTQKGLNQAKLVLVQGELSGFFGVNEDLANAQTDLSEGSSNDGNAQAVGYATRENMFIRLATGRHFRPVPAGFATEGLWPPGHHQPWGQIFVKDLQRGICDNVTPFFSITVQECYDCYYLNSFITDATFTYRSGENNSIPPCCGEFFSDLFGTGKDRYYMTLTFDNTFNNPYLNSDNEAYVGNTFGNLYYGVEGIGKDSFPGDGITPDTLAYADPIRSNVGLPSPYLARFTLNGIMTYNWSLKFINSTDVVRDFVGTGNYVANGYGFMALICSYLTGSVGIAEKITAASKCCTDLPWYDSWYGVGWNNQQSPWADFFDSPINVPASLSLHVGYNELFEPRWQWPQFTPEPIPAEPPDEVSTNPDPLDGGKNSTRIPGTRWLGSGTAD
jgi:hypothetical protein